MKQSRNIVIVCNLKLLAIMTQRAMDAGSGCLTAAEALFAKSRLLQELRKKVYEQHK
jgi:hypothetical protein